MFPEELTLYPFSGVHHILSLGRAAVCSHLLLATSLRSATLTVAHLNQTSSSSTTTSSSSYFRLPTTACFLPTSHTRHLYFQRTSLLFSSSSQCHTLYTLCSNSSEKRSRRVSLLYRAPWGVLALHYCHFHLFSIQDCFSSSSYKILLFEVYLLLYGSIIFVQRKIKTVKLAQEVVYTNIYPHL